LSVSPVIGDFSSPVLAGSHSLRWEEDAGSSELVPLCSLLSADSPRLRGVEAAHVRLLAEASADLPPILVRRSTMRVIDGMHRVAAARELGLDAVRVRFLDCGEVEAFLVAVATNINHGLPLTLADRRAAAARIIALRPEASDRWIGQIVGLAAKTVATLRKGPMTPADQAQVRRIGRDGRLRPLSAAEGRRVASEIVASNPDVSLRQIARDAGISLGTARDVKTKVLRGVDPIATRRRASRHRVDRVPPPSCSEDGEADFESVLSSLRQDPSVRYTEAGRTLLRWLSPPRLIRESDWKGIVNSIPQHRTFDVINIARNCALAWNSLADELDSRNQASLAPHRTHANRERCRHGALGQT
jgi:ParB-like nuclease domain